VHNNTVAVEKNVKDRSCQNKIKATIGIGSAIGVTAMMLSGDTTDSKAQRKYSEQEKYLESNIKMYNTIPQYHGSGFADWNERTKHHYY
jgi:hypothetical protein